MTSKWSTIPTAVITESSEKMASSTTICVTTPQNFAPLRWVGLLLSFPSSRSFSSIVALNNRKKPPNSMIKSRALKVNERKLNSGCVRVTSQEIDASSNRRINIASSSPVTRARSRCFGGSFSARMAIKTRLSMPRTSSITISVINPAQIDGSAIHSIVSTKPIRCMTNVTIRSWINRGKNAMLQHYLSHII